MWSPPDTRTGGGFTLVELLVVVIILATLAALVVPSFGASGEDAKVSALRTDLSRLRRVVGRYAAEHGGRVPGAVQPGDGRTPPPNGASCRNAVLSQLFRYTDARGVASNTPGGAFRYGPYITKGQLPANPFMTGDAAAAILCDLVTTDLSATPTADGTTGWKLYVVTGRLVPNDATVLSDGRGTVGF